LYAAWTASKVTADLKKDTDYTVFAPTNDAFKAVDSTLLDCLLKPVGNSALTEVIENHVVEGKAVAKDLKNDQELTTLEGDKVKVSIAGTVVKVGTATVTKADIMATDGVIHEIDAVLVPAKFVAPKCGSCGSIGACAVSRTAKTPPEGATLVAALKAAGLVSALEDETGPLLTVFAPTDEAFKAVGQTLLTCLLKPENKAVLGDILKLHVVPAYVLAADVKDKATEDTLLEGAKLTFGVSGAVVTVMGGSVTATVTVPNLFADNGVTHVIDKVMIPTDFKEPDNCASTTTKKATTTTKKATTKKATTTTKKASIENQIQV
jgi:uncharacterized surface protein with fasciclin (FAS1) repeats